ncbi:MAG: rod shape-determining protein RodA [Desulfobacteraceae bacterium 4572_123]|nr:MAG: rod shape-determining protein RodA [Desulfobacteraceae bacterium 4572_123]
MFDRRLAENFDWTLLGITLALSMLGLVILYSAVTAGIADPQKTLCIKQLIWHCAGLVAILIIIMFNYKILDQWAYAIYAACIVLLLCVMFFGKYVAGSRRWLALGPVSVQPSEMMKIGLIIALAHYYSKNVNINGLTLRELLIPGLLVMLPFGLIVKQPDLGTAILLTLIAGVMMVFVKIERRSFICIIGFFTAIIPLVWFLLKGYQKQRILTFLNPDRDPLGAGYHIIQSKIAIGSGMLRGKGFLSGTQNALSFLPEQHTDFIFSVLAEEWGFAGSIALLLVFLLLIFWGINVAVRCRDPFGIILSVGMTAMIFWHVFINLCMVMGLMPVVGVPLPFVSYGGSSVMTMMICVGILMNVSMRRFMFE